MVKKSKVERQADLALLMGLYFAASVATEEDPEGPPKTHYEVCVMVWTKIQIILTLK